MSRLLGAWRAVRSHRRMREVFDASVTATARLLEITWSRESSWHPHIHLLLRTDEWNEDALQLLEELWCDAVGVDRYHPVHSVCWSEPFQAERWEDNGCESAKRARYLAKYVAGVGKDDSWTDDRGVEHMSPFDTARRQVTDARTARGLEAYRRGLQDSANDEGPKHYRVRVWSEYATDLRGRRLLELDSRATALAFLGSETAEQPDIAALVHVHSAEVRDLGRQERKGGRRRGALELLLRDVEDGMPDDVEMWDDNATLSVELALQSWLGGERSPRVAPGELVVRPLAHFGGALAGATGAA